MVRTTINLDDAIYEEIVKESVEKYGSTKNISKIINQRLRIRKVSTERSKKRLSFKVRSELAGLDADLEIKKDWESNTEWKL
ncbi:MAG: hypothetical protein ACYCR7_08640 [Thermoplasmataceae archaeon]